MGPTSNANQFFGVKVSQIGTAVNQASDSQLVYKSNFSTNLFNGPNGVWKVMEGTRQPTIGNGLTEPQQGFWVSEDGIDVQQATDGQMVFSSNGVSYTHLIQPLIFKAAVGTTYTSAGGFLQCDTPLYNVGDCYDPTTFTFIVPFDGFYMFGGQALIETSNTYFSGAIFRNGAEVPDGRFWELESPGGAGNTTMSGSSTFQLTTGDEIQFHMTVGTSVTFFENYCAFWGSLIAPTSP